MRHPHQTSWGVSTRMIGAVIMVHGDDSGLVLPPNIAPVEVIIIPIGIHKEGVLDKAMELYNLLKQSYRVKIDLSDNTPGWKFSEYEMKGVPLRLEIGPRDIAEGRCVLARRDNGEKISVSLDNLQNAIKSLLDDVHNALYEKAAKNLRDKTHTAKNYEEFLDIAKNKPGFIKAMWCGDSSCEDKIKEDTNGVKPAASRLRKSIFRTTAYAAAKNKAWSSGEDS